MGRSVSSARAQRRKQTCEESVGEGVFGLDLRDVGGPHECREDTPQDGTLLVDEGLCVQGETSCAPPAPRSIYSSRGKKSTG